MSTDSDIAEIISEEYLFWVDLLVTHASSALIAYDWLLNLDDEIRLFWSRKVTAAAMLYFPIRYLVIAFWAMSYPEVWMKGMGCQVYMYTIFVLQLLLFVSPATLSALRVYALTGQNKMLALTTLFFSLGPIYANAIHYGWEKPGHYGSELNCLVLDSATHQMGVIFTVISRGLLSIGDFLVIAITVVKTIYVAKNSNGLIGSTSLARTLLYSGVVYYIPLAILNVVHMSMTVTGADQFQRTTSVVSIFMDPITSVLACRFLLNLRKAEEGRQTTTAPTAWESLQFSPGAASTLPPFIASMGELVDFGFTSLEASLTRGLEELQMTSIGSHVSDPTNVPDTKVESATLASHGDEPRIEPGNISAKETAPSINIV